MGMSLPPAGGKAGNEWGQSQDTGSAYLGDRDEEIPEAVGFTTTSGWGGRLRRKYNRLCRGQGSRGEGGLWGEGWTRDIGSK